MGYDDYFVHRQKQPRRIHISQWLKEIIVVTDPLTQYLLKKMRSQSGRTKNEASIKSFKLMVTILLHGVVVIMAFLLFLMVLDLF